MQRPKSFEPRKVGSDSSTYPTSKLTDPDSDDDDMARAVYDAMRSDADPNDPLVQQVCDARAMGYIITTETE